MSVVVVSLLAPLLKLEERQSYKDDYSRFLRAGENGCILLIPLVGAGRFERPTPCAQGSFRHARKRLVFKYLDSYGLNREQKEFNKPQAASSSWMTLRMDASAL
ncbi:MAG: hypothetical protein ABSF98_29195 [Bryobacteraceae bacterium]